MKFKLGKGAEISMCGDDGEEIRFVADKAGLIEVPDDFQEAIREITNAGHKPVKKET